MVGFGFRLGFGFGSNGLLDILDNTVEEIDVIVILGQSNNDGRVGQVDARTALSDYYDADPNKNFIWRKPAVRNDLLSNASSGTESGAAWVDDGELFYLDLDRDIAAKRINQTMGTGSDGTTGASNYYYGPESELAYRHSLAYPTKKLVVLKAAVGSSDISQWDFDTQGTGTLFKWFLDRIHDPAVAYLTGKNKTLNFIGLTWVQGEADANATDAPNYQTALTEAMTAFNTDLFAVPGKIIIQGLSTQYNGNTNGDTIETAQKAVATATSNAVYIEADGTDASPAYALKVDGVHYNEDGLEQMGIDTWAALNEFSPTKYGSDLLLWQDATDATTITETTNSVSQFDDKSANGDNATQGTTANQPVTGSRTQNSLNGLNFDGSNDFFVMSGFSIPYEAVAFCTVYIPDDTNTGDIIFGNNGSSGGTRCFEKNQSCDFGNTPLARTTTTSASALIQISWVEGTGATTQNLKINDEALRSGSVTRTGISTTFRVGCYGLGGNYGDHGLFERIIIINPTTARLNEIGNYYADKYNIAWSDIS